MRVSIFTVCVAAFAILIGGCGKGHIQIDAPKMGTPDDWWVRSAEHTHALTADLQHKKTELEVLSRTAPAGSQGAYIVEDHSGRFEEIMQRTLRSFRDWEEHESKLASAPIRPSRILETVTSPDPVDLGFYSPDNTEHVLAVRRKYAAELLNARLRLSILESRMAAADETHQKLLIDRLDAARAELQTVEAVCQAEIDSRVHAGDRVALSLISPELEADPREENPIIVETLFIPPKMDSGAAILRVLSNESNAQAELDSVQTSIRPSNAGFKPRSADTRDSIDRVIRLLQR